MKQYQVYFNYEEKKNHTVNNSIMVYADSGPEAIGAAKEKLRSVFQIYAPLTITRVTELVKKIWA